MPDWGLMLANLATNWQTGKRRYEEERLAEAAAAAKELEAQGVPGDVAMATLFGGDPADYARWAGVTFSPKVLGQVGSFGYSAERAASERGLRPSRIEAESALGEERRTAARYNTARTTTEEELLKPRVEAETALGAQRSAGAGYDLARTATEEELRGPRTEAELALAGQRSAAAGLDIARTKTETAKGTTPARLPAQEKKQQVIDTLVGLAEFYKTPAVDYVGDLERNQAAIIARIGTSGYNAIKTQVEAMTRPGKRFVPGAKSPLLRAIPLLEQRGLW